MEVVIKYGTHLRPYWIRERVCALLLFLGAICLLANQRVGIEDSSGPNLIALFTRPEVWFGTAVVMAFITMPWVTVWLRSRDLTLSAVLIYLPLGFVLFGLLGSVSSGFYYETAFDYFGVNDLIRAVLCIMLGALVFNLAVLNERFSQWLVWILVWSPLLSLVAIAAGTGLDIEVFAPGDRFSGFSSNPNIITTQTLVAFGLLTPRLIELRREKWWFRPILLVYAIALLGVTASTGTRAALVVLPVIAITVLWLRWRPTWGNLHVGFLKIVLALLFAGGAAMWLADADFLDVLLDRLEQGDDVRIQLWKYYLGHLLANPLGFGFGFESVVDTEFVTGQRLPPHNAIVLAGMYSGVFGILVVVLMLGLTWRTITRLRGQQGLSLAWVALVVSLMFGGLMPGDFSFTILTALILAARVKQ